VSALKVERQLQKQENEKHKTLGYLFQKSMDYLVSQISGDQKMQTVSVSYQPKDSAAGEVEMAIIPSEEIPAELPVDSDMLSAGAQPWDLERIDTPAQIKDFSLTFSPPSLWDRFKTSIP
jgi:hypothetical protein